MKNDAGKRKRQPQHIQSYKGQSIVLYNDKLGKVAFYGNRPFNTIEDAMADIDQDFPGVQITERSKEVFIAYAKDATNWSGIAPVGINVNSSKEDCGNLTQLKVTGLIRTFEEQGETWIHFTDKGKAYAKELGVDII